MSPLITTSNKRGAALSSLRRRRAWLALTLCLGVVGYGVPPGSEAQELRVVRRWDRRALIIMVPSGRTLGSPIDSRTGSRPVPTKGFRLVDITDGRVLGLADSSELGAGQADRHLCPRSVLEPLPVDRVCVPLRNGQLLDDHRYLLYIDNLAAYSSAGDASLKDVSALIAPVGGEVTFESTNVEIVRILHSLDFTGQAGIEPRFTINGQVTRISGPSPRPGMARCYRPSLLGFVCTLDRTLRPGDVITAVLGNGQAQAFGAIKPGTFKGQTSTANYATKDPITDAQLFIKGGIIRDAGKNNGSIQVLAQKVGIGSWRSQRGVWSGDVRPYVDLLATTDTASPGYWHVGLNVAAFRSAPHPRLLQSLGLFLTPRVEADKKATVSNFLPLDAEVRLGIRNLFSGGLPLGGAYRLWPGAGLEHGITFRGKDVERPESNRPLRWKTNATLSLLWQPDTLRAHTVGGIPYAGFRVDLSGRRYWLKRMGEGVPKQSSDAGDVTAVYRFSKNIGLAFTARDGRLPPLFKLQRTMDTSIALVF